jgi:flagellar hook assembly protein FlgD
MMKILMTLFIVFLAFSFYSKAQSDTLLINMKNNRVEKIPLSRIQKIQFEDLTGVEEVNQNTKGLDVKGNNPNPFSEQTNIEFEIANSGTVVIYIYDNIGNQIKQLECPDCLAGKHSLMWDGLDKNFRKVPSGIYFYEIRSGAEVQSNKMILVK